MLKPEMPSNCLDIIRTFVEEVTAEGMPCVQILGGVGSVALRDPDMRIDTQDKRIIVPSGLYLPNYRDDGNLRDFETIVLSNRPEDISMVADCASATIGDRLIAETFDIKDFGKIVELLARPMGSRALGMFVSDRYMPAGTTLEDGKSEAQRVLLPFSASIPHDALETWTLQVGYDMEIPVPNPAATVLNYLTRSISGLRPKDVDKVQVMASNVFEKAPETIGWVVDGPGKDQFELARILHTLRESKRHPRDLVIGDRLDVPLIRTRLEEHKAFMFRESNLRTQRAILRVARAKSRCLHIAESNERVVTAFQKSVEPAIGALVHNK